MVNSCTGKMGRAVAEAAVRAGLDLVPFTLCGAKEAEANASIEVAGQQLQLVGPQTRDDQIQQVGFNGCETAHPCRFTLYAVLHSSHSMA